MSKYKLGDPDYVIPGAGKEALEWEIGRLTEEVIPALEQRIAELEKHASRLEETIDDLNVMVHCREERIAQLEEFVGRVANYDACRIGFTQEAWKLLERHKTSRIEEPQQRVAELEQVLREIDQDPSQIILTDAQRKILEKGK